MSEQVRQNIFILVILTVLAVVAFFLWQDNDEFVLETDSWQTVSDPIEGISFDYPEEIDATYIHLMDWPPQISLSDETYTCTEAGDVFDRAGRTERRVIDGREYCVTEIREGAAGSVYSLFAFITPTEISGAETINATFSLRAEQCANYDESEKIDCEREREEFSIDEIIHQVIESVRRPA